MAVRVVPYSDAWPSEFAAVRTELLAAFSDDTILIEHIGNTPGPVREAGHRWPRRVLVAEDH